MSSSSLAQQRLAEERKNFRKQRQFGFVAKPLSKPDGSVDLLTWSCKVPGKPHTLCEGAKYTVTLHFSNDFPSKPPKVFLPKNFFHVNVCSRSGAVCLSMLKASWSLLFLSCAQHASVCMGPMHLGSAI